jgi:hypothetical protein
VKIEILNLAELDILDGFHFYESQESGLGSYFLENIYSDIDSDIDSLALIAGIHLKPHKNFHRLLSKKNSRSQFIIPSPAKRLSFTPSLTVVATRLGSGKGSLKPEAHFAL